MKFAYAYLMVLSLAVMSGITFAEGNLAANPQISGITQNMVSAAMGQVNCKTNLTVNYINQIIAAVPNSSSTLSPFVTNLQQDTTQLQSIASSGNATQFRSYVSGTYDPLFASLRGKIMSSLHSSKLNESQIAPLRKKYDSIKSQYSQCAFPNLKQFAQQKLAYYKAAISTIQQQEKELSAKGVDVSAINTDIANANSTVIIPFQNAINSANNVTQLESALKKYCLFNGCNNGINYHLAAHVSYDRINAVIAKAQTYNLTANQTRSITNAKGFLSSAYSILSSAGTSHINSDNEKQMWNYMKNASAALKGGLAKR